MRTHLSFETTPGVAIDAEAGARLAARLTAALTARGIEATVPSALDYAHEFEIRHGGQKFYSMLGPANDGVRQWLWFADSTLGAVGRWLGRRDDTAHVAVLRAMDQVVRDLGATSIRWYEAIDWNEAPDERWHPDPVV